jgi:hypothetical protein
MANQVVVRVMAAVHSAVVPKAADLGRDKDKGKIAIKAKKFIMDSQPL